MRTFAKFAGLASASIFFLSEVNASAQGIDFAKTEIMTQQLAPNFYVLTGSAGTDPGHPEAAGGRIGVLAGSEGPDVQLRVAEPRRAAQSGPGSCDELLNSQCELLDHGRLRGHDGDTCPD